MTDHHHASSPASPDAQRRTGASASDAESPEREARPLRRDRRHKMLGGVCAGLGRQCDMDPVIFRITLAVLSATGGIGLVFYGFTWLFVPYEDEEENEIRRLLTGRVDGPALASVLFALVGCGVFLSMLGDGGLLTFGAVLSLLLAGAGYWSRRRDAPGPDPLAVQAVADAPPEAQAPPIAASLPSWWREPIVKDGTFVGGTGYLWGPGDLGDTSDQELAAALAVSRGGVTDQVAGRRGQTGRNKPAGPRRPRSLGGVTFLLALVVGSLVTGLSQAGTPAVTAVQHGLACALLVLGAGLVTSSFLGRTGAGTVFWGLVTAGMLTVTAALPRDVDADWIRREWRPASVADTRAGYQLGLGLARLDLTDLPVTDGQTVPVRVEVGTGRVEVVVPDDVTVRTRIDVGLGDIRSPSDSGRDTGAGAGLTEEYTLRAVDGGKGTDGDGGRDGNGDGDGGDDGKAGTIELWVEVGAGNAEVTRVAS
ncbi:PspC domain-containing protein [Streptomyces sp. MJP52]|uniref:PspC domain-containing protein n=1 Tax=Streptomyces sp. MJP52 TaxID=2940555 RepID=UPI002473AF5C|nr:PspC domain-containing protein [Streptomyces sp. MJP52]MDH6225462.1 phage shock protein PspC (stress-responsive transcriptional regulator) [Streptomyces sp. MJP52]